MRLTSSALSGIVMVACIATSFAGNDRKDVCGIGVKFGLKGDAVIVEEVYPGWGAEKAGLPVGSKTVSIDGKVTKGMALQDVVGLIHEGGGEGDIVSLTVLQDSGQRKTYEIARTFPPPLDEVTFRTAAKAPAGFDSWTFFWNLPEIAPDASLVYRVIQPDGKTYMSYGPIKGPPGQLLKSDFSKGFAGGDPTVFFNQDIVVKIMVDKGKMKFDPKANYRFQFHNTIKANKEQATETGAAVKYGMYICYGLATFSENQSWMSGKDFPPIERFNPPSTLNVRGWARAAKEAGMTFAVFNVKDESGFCLWDAKDYGYSMAKSPYKGDIIRDFIRACIAEGIEPGIHYCIPDVRNEGITSYNRDLKVSAAYFDVIKQHLSELNSKYPQLRLEIIGGAERLSSNQLVNLTQVILRQNPDCAIWETTGDDVGPHHVAATTLGSWFWWPGYKVQTQKMLDRVVLANSSNKALILNVGPTREGKIPEDQLAALKTVKEIMTRQSPANKEDTSMGQQLIDLKRAKDAGAITDAEFQAQKSKLLGN